MGFDARAQAITAKPVEFSHGTKTVWEFDFLKISCCFSLEKCAHPYHQSSVHSPFVSSNFVGKMAILAAHECSSPNNNNNNNNNPFLREQNILLMEDILHQLIPSRKLPWIPKMMVWKIYSFKTWPLLVSMFDFWDVVSLFQYVICQVSGQIILVHQL